MLDNTEFSTALSMPQSDREESPITT